MKSLPAKSTLKRPPTPHSQRADGALRAMATTHTESDAPHASKRTREDRYESAFKHDLTANFIARPDGTLFDCNRAFVRTFGFASRRLALDCRLGALMARRPMWSALMRQLRLRHPLVRQPCDWVRSDGTRLHMIQTMVGRHDKKGQLIEVLGFLFDDTERTQASIELDHSRGRLEELVKKQTADLQSSFEQLRLADRMASLGTLAAGLGHDMNNVLLPVRVQLNVLMAASTRLQKQAGETQDSRESSRLAQPSTQNPVDIRPAVRAIGASVAYLQQLADGLHYLAQNPDDSHPDEASTDLREWWHRAGVVISKAVPRHVRLSASFSGTLPPVCVAPHRLTQAVLNLVVNAGEAIPTLEDDPSRKRRQGSVRITVRAQTDDAGQEWVTLAVTDNGRGMTPEVKRRAFELFFTTKSRGHGTGLGLPLVHKVAARVGGRVEIETEVGKGTTVAMWLPAAQPTDEAQREYRATISIADPRLASLVRHVLEAGGVGIADHDPRGVAADLWVSDTAGSGAWKFARRGRRAPHLVTIPSAADFATVRDVIAEALFRVSSSSSP